MCRLAFRLNDIEEKRNPFSSSLSPSRPSRPLSWSKKPLPKLIRASPMDSLLASPGEAPTDPHLPFQVTFCCLHSEDEKAVTLP